MKINIQQAIKAKKGLIIVPIFKEQLKKIPQHFPVEIKEFIKERVEDEELSGKFGEVITTYPASEKLPPKLLVVCLGSEEKYRPSDARNLGGKLGKFTQKGSSTEVNVLLNSKTDIHFQEFLEGLFLAQYKVDTYKTNLEEVAARYSLKILNIVVEDKKQEKEIGKSLKKAEMIAGAINFAKELVNNPPNVVDSEYLAETARKIAKENRYKIAVLGQKQLEKIKAGGILAVNQGAAKEPKLIVLEYDGGKRKEKPLIFIGKGVIFDSGGYNLKMRNSIETMHQDMAGAATVLGIFSLLKKLGIKKNVIGIMPVVENMVSSKAYKPSDILTLLSGKTVEITNTDAEGRLILADALTYAGNFEPESMITIATLTGAAGVAVGDRYASVMGNNLALQNQLQDAGDEVDDWVWPLPLCKHYAEKMKSKVADFVNYDRGTGGFAGSSKGGQFLQFFVENLPWCHIDIGGTAFTTDPKPYQSKGATGHSLRLLIRFLEKHYT